MNPIGFNKDLFNAQYFKLCKAEKSDENLKKCQNFCLPKNFVRQIFCPPNTFVLPSIYHILNIMVPLLKDNFNYNESFPLSLSISSNKKMLSTLIISDFSSNDSSIIQILGDNDSVVFNYLINLNKTHSSSINYTNPNTASLRLNSFSGILNWVITESSE